MIELPDGAQSPQLGFGVFQIPPDETADAVKTALQIGYRHIDTAEMYQNERGLGQGIRDAGLDRADLYITSSSTTVVTVLTMHDVHSITR